MLYSHVNTSYFSFVCEQYSIPKLAPQDSGTRACRDAHKGAFCRSLFFLGFSDSVQRACRFCFSTLLQFFTASKIPSAVLAEFGAGARLQTFGGRWNCFRSVKSIHTVKLSLEWHHHMVVEHVSRVNGSSSIRAVIEDEERFYYLSTLKV